MFWNGFIVGLGFGVAFTITATLFLIFWYDGAPMQKVNKDGAS